MVNYNRKVKIYVKLGFQANKMIIIMYLYCKKNNNKLIKKTVFLLCKVCYA